MAGLPWKGTTVVLHLNPSSSNIKSQEISLGHIMLNLLSKDLSSRKICCIFFFSHEAYFHPNQSNFIDSNILYIFKKIDLIKLTIMAMLHFKSKLMI